MSSYCHRCLHPVDPASARCEACDTVARSSGWPTDPRLGTVVAGGQYRVCRRLGRGGFGTVYLVETVVGGLRRAMKVLHPEIAGDPEVRDRLVREALVLERVSHPNVARCYAVGTLDEHDSLYLLLELVEGTPLHVLLQTPGGRPRPMEPIRAVRLVKQVASGLVAVHGSGALHRDLKPQNILVVRPGEPDEQVKLVDFGLARVLEERDATTQQLVGTPAFMAPEQLRPASASDVRTDLWQLGAVLHMALTGDPPYDVDPSEPLKVLAQHAQRQAAGPRPSLRRPELLAVEPLDAYAARLLASDLDARPRSAAIVCAELARLEHTLVPQHATGTLALLDALCATPSEAGWWALVQYLSRADADEAALAHDAEARLESWPDALRRAPLAWFDAACAGASPFWPLARRLDLRGRGLGDHDLAEILDHPALATLTQLDLSDNEITDEGLARLHQSSHLRRLRELRLARNRITSAGLEHLAQGGLLGRLHVLDLAGNGVGARGAALIATHAAHLRALDLTANGIGAAGAHAIAGAACAAVLRDLRLGGNGLGSDGAAALATARALDGLERLDLSENAIGTGGTAALAVSPMGGRLQALDLHGNDLGPAALDVLLSSGRYAELRVLDLAGNRLGPTGAMLLASTVFARRLKQLDVSDNGLGDAGLAALLGGQPLAGLHALRTARNGITGAAVALLGSAPAELETLDLSGNPLEAEGLQALADVLGRLRIRHLALVDVPGAPVPLRALVTAGRPGLVSLDVSGTLLTDDALADLARAPVPTPLEALVLSRTGITSAGLASLGAGVCPALGRLAIDGLHAGDADASRMIEALETCPGLTELSCADNAGESGLARTLARSSLTHRLVRLDLSHNRLGDAGVEALAHGAWHVLRELTLDQNDVGAAGLASLLTAPTLPLLWRLHAAHNVVAGGAVDLHMLPTHVVARMEASFAVLAASGADFAARFYDLLFARHPGIAPLFRRTSMQRQHQHLMTVLAFLVDHLRHPDAVAQSLTDLAARHVGYGVSPSHYYALTAVLLEVIGETLGDEFTPEVEAAWHEGLTAVVTVMLSAHRAQGASRASAAGAGRPAGITAASGGHAATPVP